MKKLDEAIKLIDLKADAKLRETDDSTEKPAKNQGGRPKGSRNKTAVEYAMELSKAGLAPIEVLLGAMRIAWARSSEFDGKGRGEQKTANTAYASQLRKEAVACASAAAPYCHPKLSAIEHSGGVEISHEEALDMLDITPEPPKSIQ